MSGSSGRSSTSRWPSLTVIGERWPHWPQGETPQALSEPVYQILVDHPADVQLQQ
jgi:hypothetical protein